MAITLLDMLLNAGLIDHDQFEEALRNRVLHGGKIGTSLIELGYVTEETLARFLSTKLAVPYVPPQMLLEIPETVISQFPRELAIKYRVIPLRVEKKRLDLVMADPADLTAIDEIGFITGFNIQPHVTPEVRLAQAFSRYYQEEMEPRYQQLIEVLETRRQEEQTRRQEEEANRWAEEIRRQEEELRRHEEERLLAEEARQREEEARRVHVYDLSDDDIVELTEPQQPAEPPAAAEETPEVIELQDAVPAADWPDHIRRMEPDAVSRALAYADSAEDIIDNLLAGLGGKIQRVAFFRVKGNRVVGWKGIDRNQPLQDFAQLSLPLTEPSVLRTVTENAGYYLGPLQDTPLNHLLHDVFGGAPQTLLLMPLIVGGRIASIVYAEDGDGLSAMVPELQRLLAKAAMAFEMLIYRDKILML